MKEFHRRDFANRTGLAQAWTVKSADRLFTALNETFPRPFCPELGANFQQLAIAEIPKERVVMRLKASELSSIPVCQWAFSDPNVAHFWTDGSIQNPLHFWHMCGGFSVVAQDGSLRSSGQVYHPALCSYTTEFFALIVCFAQSASPVCVHTDCKTLTQQVAFLNQTNQLPFTWSHLTWWLWLRDLLNQRRQFSTKPLDAVWCPLLLFIHDPNLFCQIT